METGSDKVWGETESWPFGRRILRGKMSLVATPVSLILQVITLISDFGFFLIRLIRLMLQKNFQREKVRKEEAPWDTIMMVNTWVGRN